MLLDRSSRSATTAAIRQAAANRAAVLALMMSR
jgi:hypothetical protein